MSKTLTRYIKRPSLIGNGLRAECSMGSDKAGGSAPSGGVDAGSSQTILFVPRTPPAVSWGLPGGLRLQMAFNVGHVQRPLARQGALPPGFIE